MVTEHVLILTSLMAVTLSLFLSAPPVFQANRTSLFLEVVMLCSASGHSSRSFSYSENFLSPDAQWCLNTRSSYSSSPPKRPFSYEDWNSWQCIRFLFSDPIGIQSLSLSLALAHKLSLSLSFFTHTLTHTEQHFFNWFSYLVDYNLSEEKNQVCLIPTMPGPLYVLNKQYMNPFGLHSNPYS